MAGGQRETESDYASRTANPPPTTKTVILKQGVLYQGQYYAVAVPAGQQLTGAEQTFVQTPADVGREDVAGKEALQVTTQIKTEQVPMGSPFGATLSYYEPDTGRLTTEYKTATGKTVTQVEATRRTDSLYGSQSPSVVEQKALLGSGLASVAAVSVALPVAGAFGLAAVGTGEVVKQMTTGSHLTPSEAVGLAGVGTMVGVGAMYGREVLRGRVESRLESGYRSAVEQQQMFRPSSMEKFAMKVTGAKTPRLATEIVGAGEAPPISFKMLSQKNLGASEEAYFWDTPTPRSSQVYVAGVQGSKAKTWVGEHLIKSVSGGLSYALIQQELVEVSDRSLPYIPVAPYITSASRVLPLGVAGIAVAPALSLFGQPSPLTSQTQRVFLAQRARQLPKQPQRQSMFLDSVQRDVLDTVSGPVQSSRAEPTQRSFPMMSVSQIVEQRQNMSRTQAPLLQQRDLQEQALAPVVPQMQVATSVLKTPAAPPIYFYDEPQKRRRRKLSELWIPRTHPVKTWQQMIGLKPVRRKKHR